MRSIQTWSVDECKQVLGAYIRKNNVKGIICCHREFGLALATQQSQRNSELEEQNKELQARISALTKKLNRNKALEKTDMEVSQPDNIYPDLQAFFETDVAIQSVTDVPVDLVKVCGARRRSQGIEGIESVPPSSSVVQVQAIAKMLGPKDIERLSQSLLSARTNFSEFRRALISKMRLYDMSLAEVTQLMSQILTESEFNSFESAVTSELQHASKGDLRESVLKILKNIMGPKIDCSRITNCVQRKEETVSEYTEKFCQSAVTYSGIVDDPESVLDDKGPLVPIWADSLVAEYRKALPFLDLTWSNKTFRSNLDTLVTWERDDAKPAYNTEVVPLVTSETLGQLTQALLRAQKEQEKTVGAVSSYLSPVIHHNDKIIFVKGSIQEKAIDFLLDTEDALRDNRIYLQKKEDALRGITQNSPQMKNTTRRTADLEEEIGLMSK
ncbi:GMP synthase [glutamine-hydrolyzing] [Labeo rohita]|uniref:GMP synthase [glutamine-hydrolyzing] n=1 Tax=Labeo rohita TaxID=84645 RepID=A0ABQ8LVJ6_LABRO|nr:GMP synthase [glutamine-hydrolyzing] [Labeo rohita]